MVNSKRIVENILGKKEKTFKQEYEIGQPVWFKDRKAVIADHMNGRYLLWDATGKNEFLYKSEDIGWVNEILLSPRDQND